MTAGRTRSRVRSATASWEHSGLFPGLNADWRESSQRYLLESQALAHRPLYSVRAGLSAGFVLADCLVPGRQRASSYVQRYRLAEAPDGRGAGFAPPRHSSMPIEVDGGLIWSGGKGFGVMPLRYRPHRGPLGAMVVTSRSDERLPLGESDRARAADRRGSA
jgi:hypothetical protein